SSLLKDSSAFQNCGTIWSLALGSSHLILVFWRSREMSSSGSPQTLCSSSVGVSSWNGAASSSESLNGGMVEGPQHLGRNWPAVGIAMKGGGTMDTRPHLMQVS